MATLAALKAKWFIDPAAPASFFPPRTRAPGTSVRPHTDGNLVTPFIDGQAYMAEWNSRVTALGPVAGAELYQGAWRLEGVQPLGSAAAAPDALDVLNDADGAGAAVYPLICRNPMTFVINASTVDWLRLHGVWKAVLDSRFPIGGSNHQKFHCFKNPGDPRVGLGSIDISRTRWDRSAHLAHDPMRPLLQRDAPTHDVAVLVAGDAVADLERCFTERWNDPTRTTGMVPLLPPQPKITTAPSPPRSMGTQSIQVLRTYGRTSTFYGYSWSPVGEFTIWASYLNAIRQAQQVIYIEDQYFLPFDFPLALNDPGPRQESDIVWQLGQAIRRGVKVVVLVPGNAEDSLHVYQKYQRDLGVKHLRDAAAAGTNGGDAIVATLANGPDPIYVHSKLMLVDDEFALVGSANIGQRSMAHDGELQIGIVDAASPWVADFRRTLWAEHMNVPPGSFTDLLGDTAAFEIAVNAGAAGTSRLRRYEVPNPIGAPPGGHGDMIRRLVDRYAGPPR